MSTAEILSLISLISYILAGISFALAVFFFFRFNIPAVIGDLSGRTARKSIARMRESNEKAGGRGYKSSSVNASRGKLTGTMTDSGKQTNKAKKPEPKAKKAEPKAKKAELGEDARPETGLLAENRAELAESQATAMLVEDDATGLLVDMDETMPLNAVPVRPAKRSGGKKLTMLDDIMLIHTDEVLR